MICPKCGQQLPPESSFCNVCGSPLGRGSGRGTGQTVTGLTPNVLALLAYCFVWVSGLVLFFVEKDRFIRFHAAQSIIFFGGVQIVYQSTKVVAIIAPLQWIFATIAFVVYTGVALLAFVVWILMMVKAYQGEYYKLPVVGDLAERVVDNFQSR